MAAAGLVALETGPGRLKEDHENARWLAGRLAGIDGLEVDPDKVPTNIIIFALKRSGVRSSDLLAALRVRGVLAVPVDDRRVRMVTHRDVSRADIERAAEITEMVMKEGIG